MGQKFDKTLQELRQLEEVELRQLEELRQKIVELEAQTLLYKTQINNLTSQLANSKTNFSKSFISSPIPSGLWQYSRGDLEFVDYNSQAFDITKGTAEDLLGISASELYHDDVNTLYDLHKILATKNEFSVDRFHQLRTINERKYLSISYIFLPPDLVLVQAADKTMYKHLEQVLLNLASKNIEENHIQPQKATDILLTKLSENILDGVLIADNNSNVIYANKSAYTILELREKDLIGRSYYEVLLSNNNLILPPQSYQLNDEKSKSYNIEFHSKSKKQILLNVMVVSLREIHPCSSLSMVILRGLEKENSDLFLPFINKDQSENCCCHQKEIKQEPISREKILTQRLTSREKEILILLATGIATEDLAKQLFISVATTRNHISSIFHKLNVHSRIQAIAYAQKLQII